MRYLFLLLISVTAWAGEMDLFLDSYVKNLAEGRTSGINSRPDFAHQLAQDTSEFKACAGKNCTVRMRANPSFRSKEGDIELWEAHFDIYSGGKRLIRRSGCYLIEKGPRGLYFNGYIYECYPR
jgi:hypothetical protein